MKETREGRARTESRCSRETVALYAGSRVRDPRGDLGTDAVRGRCRSCRAGRALPRRRRWPAVLAADPAFLGRRWQAAGTSALQGRDRAGRLIAAGALRPVSGGVAFCGLVDPRARGRGLGAHLLGWGLAEAAGPVTVETESLTAAAAELFAAHGLEQVFAEDVMRIDLDTGVPAAAGPDGMRFSGWSGENAPRFHGVYAAAFRERPGYPGWSEAEWIAEVAGDDEFRPQWSVLATLPKLGDAGFVTAAVDWIVQVGVVPAARRRGVGEALVTEALRRRAGCGPMKRLPFDQMASLLGCNGGCGLSWRRQAIVPDTSFGEGLCPVGEDIRARASPRIAGVMC